ncbi:MAG: hypothetical protein R2684_03010 [Pyrinomonadaceae bacterium]
MKGNDIIRVPLTDAELEKLSASEAHCMKLSEDESRRLRAINTKRLEENKRKRVEWRKAEEPLAAELRSSGFEVNSAWDLFSNNEPWIKKKKIRAYTRALPILLRHIELPYPDAVREGIARALSEKRGSFEEAGLDPDLVWRKIVNLFAKEPNGTRAKMGLAVALSAMSDKRTLNEIIQLCKDRTNGEDRIILLSVLERSGEASAEAALRDLETDPELMMEISEIRKRQARREKRRQSQKKH